MSAPSRITWVAVKGRGDVAMVVAEEQQSEYANIIRLRKDPATREEVESWIFQSSERQEP